MSYSDALLGLVVLKGVEPDKPANDGGAES